MTNRTPHIPEDQREAYEKSSFVNEPAKADQTPVTAVKPASARKAAPAKKKASK